MIILALAGGIIGAVAAVALRSPRRREAARAGVVDDRFAYLSLPGFSLFLIGIGIAGLTLPGISTQPVAILLTALMVLSVLMMITGAVLSVWGLFGKTVPLWALPAWKR